MAETSLNRAQGEYEMAVNLSKVNISLNEFQRLSVGEHNAGEVKLDR